MKTQSASLKETNKLYVGTSEAIAKTAPIRGLDPPAILTDVYPAYFALSECDGGRAGIVEVNIERLMPDYFAPFHGFVERASRRKNYDNNQILRRREECLCNIDKQKAKWRNSLQSCGVCLYLLQIPADAVTKVTIYDSHGRGSNEFVTRAGLAANPWDVSPAEHRASYDRNHELTRWLLCEPVASDEMLFNRQGLDVFYRKTDKDGHAWWRVNWRG